ncbi:MAG: hypothetical protein ACXVWZ_11560 [Nocardioides sp.]
MTGPQTLDLVDVDPFDLPDWLGESDVVWEPDLGIRTGHHVRGHLMGAGEQLPCDLLAVDEAYPVPVADDQARLHAHQAWRHGQLLLVEVDGRLTLAVPGTSFAADTVLDALSRLARAVGASTDRFSALLRIGTDKPRRSG